MKPKAGVPVTCLARIERVGFEGADEEPSMTYWLEFTDKVERGPQTWLFKVSRPEWESVAVAELYTITPLEGEGPRVYTKVEGANEHHRSGNASDALVVESTGGGRDADIAGVSGEPDLGGLDRAPDLPGQHDLAGAPEGQPIAPKARRGGRRPADRERGGEAPE